MGQIVKNIIDDNEINILLTVIQSKYCIKSFDRYLETFSFPNIAGSEISNNINPKIFYVNKLMTFFNNEGVARIVELQLYVDGLLSDIIRSSIGNNAHVSVTDNYLFNKLTFTPSISSPESIVYFIGYKIEIE